MILFDNLGAKLATISKQRAKITGLLCDGD